MNILDSQVEHQLTQQLQWLEQQVQQFTSINKLPKTRWMNNSDYFNSSCFYCQSDDIKDYVKEVANNLNKLKQARHQQQAEYLAERLTEQFSCFRNLFQSLDINQKNALYNKRKFSQVKSNQLQRVKQLAKQATQSSQELYAELSKLQEYERRLQEMVEEKQRQLSSYSGNKHRAEYQQQVLTTQQRLGRCRQAISKTEEQIQKLDNRNL